MAYATYTDIASEFKNIVFNSNKTLTDAEVTAYIQQEEAVINATVSNRYETPVTGAEAVKILKSISIAFVAYRVAKTLNLKKDLPIPGKFVPQILNEGSAFREAKETLKMIQAGTIVLSDATPLSLQQGIKSYNATNSIAPLWERDTKQW